MNILALQHTNFLGGLSFKLAEWAKAAFPQSQLILVTSSKPEIIDLTHVDDVWFGEKHQFTFDEITNFLNDRAIDLVLFHVEADMMLSAQLRQEYDIAGQNIISAQAFRDKNQMKTLCANNGIAVPKFKKYKNQNLAQNIRNDFEFPVVVKPLDGSGSRDTFMLESASELDQLSGLQDYKEVLAESFIPYDIYHVDGIVNEGKVIFSCVHKYISPNLSFQDGCIHGSILLDPESDGAKCLSEFTINVIDAMPETENFVFHCEIFYQADKEPLLCEIASRPAGALIPQSISRAFDVDINQVFIQQQMGKRYDATHFQDSPSHYTAYLLFPPLKGTLNVKEFAVPENLGIIEYHCNYEQGKYYQVGSNSVSNVFCCLLSADSPESLEQHCQMTVQWYQRAFFFEE
jgi:hypothetical protein